ncbi:MAG: caspase family protein [Fodinibius sp.]|nr:caspase family protein [Fodinibius sp.]
MAAEYDLVEQDYFLKPGKAVTPENPTLRLDLYSKSKYQYTQRVLMQRNIQDYRLDPASIALGMGGATLAFYLANAKGINGAGSKSKSWTLNAAGGLFLLSGFLNMKAVEEPRPTGEEKYLRGTGTIIKLTPHKLDRTLDSAPTLTVRYNNNVIFSEYERPFSGTLEIPLAGKVEELELAGANPGNLDIAVTFKDSTYQYSYPVEQVLQPYARVTAQLTELRNQPQENEDNILADLVKDSRLRIKSTENEQWYQVLYGISENYIRKEDAELIWRAAGFAEDSDVITVPRVPFGNIDVESNIPILRGPAANRLALIVTNENYTGDRQERNYAHRDGKLMKTYLTTALGYFKENIYELRDIGSAEEIYQRVAQMRSETNDNTELFVYISGYGVVNSQQQSLGLLTVTEQQANQDTVQLSKLNQQLAALTTGKTTVLNDIDFAASARSQQVSANEEQSLIDAATLALRRDARAAVLMGTQLRYPSSLYVSSEGDDKKHYIFPYFFAKALQQRKTNIAAIYQYLERNISYTARKLFDRPQDPLLLGNSSIDLISQ